MLQPIKKEQSEGMDEEAQDEPACSNAKTEEQVLPQREFSPEEKALFDNAINMARTLTRTLGRLCEIAVHDFQDLEHSLIHIEGGLTGRTSGAPITNVVIKAWRQHGDAVENLVGYPASTRNGRTLKSSTCFIRNSNGKVIGAFCLNLDITDFQNFQSAMQSFIRMETTTNRDTPEAIASSLSETTESIIETAIKRAGRHPVSMTREEKKEFVRILDEEGAFLMKGMVQHVAKILQVSIFTIYNYMRQANKQDLPRS